MTLPSYSTSHNFHKESNPHENHVFVDAQFVLDDNSALSIKHYTYFCPLRFAPVVGKWMRVHNGNKYCWVRISRVGAGFAQKAQIALRTISSPGAVGQQALLNDKHKHLWEPNMSKAEWNTRGTEAPHRDYYVVKGESGEYYFCDESYGPLVGKWIEIAIPQNYERNRYEYDKLVYVSSEYQTRWHSPILVANNLRNGEFIPAPGNIRIANIEDVLTPINTNAQPENDMALKIENKVFINDADSKGFNDNDLIEKIAQAEAEIDRLNLIKAKSTKIEARKADLQAGIEKLTTLLDSR